MEVFTAEVVANILTQASSFLGLLPPLSSASPNWSADFANSVMYKPGQKCPLLQKGHQMWFHLRHKEPAPKPLVRGLLFPMRGGYVFCWTR